MHSDNMKRTVADLLETVSRTLAPTKVEMDVFIENELRLNAHDGAGGRAYLDELQSARHLLNNSPDLPTFITALRDEVSGASTSPAEFATQISTMVAGWALVIAILVASVAGYLIWPWWIAGFAALSAAFAREVTQLLQLTHHIDRGFFIRSMLMTILIVFAFWGIGRGLSQLF